MLIMYSKLKIGQTDRCPCYTAPRTTQHLLQDCPLHNAIREEAKPKDTFLTDMLFGDPQAVRRTVAFVRATVVYI